MQLNKMLIKKQQAKEKTTSKTCKVWEYGFENKNLGIAAVKIDGRYPEKGKAMNKECDEIYYVISGEAKVNVDGKEFNIAEGDALFLPKAKPYFVEAKKLFLLVSNNPSWNAEQYEIIE
jgi:mannose-6-phosphate isomerase-like protein (cupin superfamily)